MYFRCMEDKSRRRKINRLLKLKIKINGKIDRTIETNKKKDERKK